MRAVVVFCHPKPDSFNAAVLEVVLERLRAAGAEFRLNDLYRRSFDPVLGAGELDAYLDTSRNRAPVAEDVDDLLWCDTLIFVYPTWWYGLPAMLKGWLDRVMVPDVAFLMPDKHNADIRPGLTHISRIGVFTTCGASWWLTRYVGAPGKGTLLRGLGVICAPRRKTVFAAHYVMDSSTPQTRAAFLRKVARKTDQLTEAKAKAALAAAAT